MLEAAALGARETGAAFAVGPTGLAGPANSGRFPLPIQVGDGDPPEIFAEIDASEIASRIATWRAGNPQFDNLLRGKAPPAQSLRRLALTHWSAGNPRLASVILATAAALQPEDAALWLDFGLTLQASGDRAKAFAALERSLALDPAPARAWLGLAILANERSQKSRAEAAFAAALARDPTLSEAAFGLGLLCFEQRRYGEAAAHWRAAIAAGFQSPHVFAGLGQSLFFLGDFAGAARALAQRIALAPAESKLVQRFALARFLETVLAGEVASASEAYAAAAGAHAEASLNVARSAFHILSAYGHEAAALRIAQQLLPDDGDDPVQRYLKAAIAGETLERAPVDYLVAYFDRFAEGFDKQLVDVLEYRVPEKLIGLVAATGKPLPRAVDVGCGTGLAGPQMRAFATRLVGVDVSPRMLAKAAERKVYDSLVEAEMIAFLQNASERFDLVFAADVLVYLGDLQAFLSAAARVAAPGGVVAFNIETTSRAPYVLLPSGRFAHSLQALLANAAPWFTPKASQRAFLRIEANKRIHGALVLLERRDD